MENFPFPLLTLKKQTVMNSIAIRKCILPATWGSLEMNPSLVECPDKNTAQQTPDFSFVRPEAENPTKSGPDSWPMESVR